MSLLNCEAPTVEFLEKLRGIDPTLAEFALQYEIVKSEAVAKLAKRREAETAELDALAKNSLRLIEEVRKLAKPDGKLVRFECPLCKELAIGYIAPANGHVVASCKCSPWVHMGG